MLKVRTIWAIGAVLTFAIVIIALFFIYTYKVEFNAPKFTFMTLAIMAVFSFPPSYISRMIADNVMNQSTHIGDVMKECTVGVIIHWSIYIPEFIVYNYLVFGELMEFPSLSAIEGIMPNMFQGYIFPLTFLIVYPFIAEKYMVLPLMRKILVKIKRKKWFEQTNLKNIEVERK